ncbi:hypothetical protein SAMN06272775_5183 [Streptomyces sp. 2323.1]|nr:hypothetical protein SAMN06272775_5183 [Streptomyces sp. 2323.1]
MSGAVTDLRGLVCGLLRFTSTHQAPPARPLPLWEKWNVGGGLRRTGYSSVQRTLSPPLIAVWQGPFVIFFSFTYAFHFLVPLAASPWISVTT